MAGGPEGETAGVRGPRSEMTTTMVILACLIAGSGYVFISLGAFGACVLLISGLASLVVWRALYLPAEDAAHLILPAFCLSAAGFLINLIEEFATGYAPAVSRMFGIGWTQRSFVMIALALGAVLFLVVAGLYGRRPLAGYLACYFLISRLAELSMFVFPFVTPAIRPHEPAPVTATLGGTLVADMPNHALAVSGHFYFPGMFTVILTIAPALYAVWRLRQGRIHATNGSAR